MIWLLSKQVVNPKTLTFFMIETKKYMGKKNLPNGYEKNQ